MQRSIAATVRSGSGAKFSTNFTPIPETSFDPRHCAKQGRRLKCRNSAATRINITLRSNQNGRTSCVKGGNGIARVVADLDAAV